MDVLQICIYDVKMLNYGIKYAYWIIFLNKVTDTVRKKKIIVLIVYFDFALQI